jgi:hypothetical protein
MPDLLFFRNAAKNIEQRIANDSLFVTEKISADGGVVLDWGRVGVFWRGPSTSYKVGAIYYWFETVYGSRRGTWFVITYDGGMAPEWFWKDLMGQLDLPVAPTLGEKVDNRISAMTELSGNKILLIFLVFTLIVAAVCVKLFYL